MNDHATHNPMQSHLDAYAESHPDQMVAHLTGEHGWTVHEHERGDRLVLQAMHRVAHEDDTEDAAYCPKHGLATITETYIYTGFAGGCSWALRVACGCLLLDESADVRSAR